MASLLERLRYETRPLHEQTEQLFYTEALQNGTLSTEEYLHLLRTHLTFHQSLEAALDQYPDFFREFEPDTRRKMPWLQNDLIQLNEPLPKLKPALFATWSPVSLVGAAYVSEGSMLGGTVIWRLLQKNPAIQPLLAQARFYQGYGSDTGSQWKRFGEFALQKGGSQPDEVVEAAQKAFSEYQRIFLHLKSPVSQEAC
ncbi:biliverdin-producing heme oxygenase [Spirosoma sp. KNUC1025]|uniref:biliverdin-producing heme oxygenase n=1 Tax=Spirosoma sp. KNUC1025 TaxID=2894082 RepID=UPI0038658D3A|nr:biliverdin-producing heme oxygenase [Spirosoma sp. KNUC1025]